MKKKDRNNIKEYELEEGQKMKISDENEEQIEHSNYRPNMAIIYSLIALIIIIIIGLGIFIYFQLREEEDNSIRLKPRIEATPIHPESGVEPGQMIQLNKPLQPGFQNLSNNNEDELVYKGYELKHYKPDTLDLQFYTKYLPKKDINETIMDLNEIFSSKYLYINNSKITYNYIYLIRQKDFKNDQDRKISFKDKDFHDYKGTEKSKMNLREFYELCDDDTPSPAIDKNYFMNPLVSIVVAVYNVNQKLMRTIKSIQNQSFKNIEIIIVDDLKNNLTANYSSIIEQDFRIRVFMQKKFYSLWRKRMDGFLYSRGKYILHLDAGHTLADNYVIEDIYNLADQYDLDTVRFSFSRTVYNDAFIQNKTFAAMKFYPYKMTKIIYGRPDYDVHQFGYGTIWNRLVRADMFSKGLDLVDGNVLNIKKNLWEDMWWNDLIDRVSFSNLIVNRLGYIFLYNRNISFEPFIYSPKRKDKTIREFIYFWYFDLILLPKNDDKKSVIFTLKRYADKNNTFCRIPMRLSFLRKKCKLLSSLINKLLSDPYVSFNDKMYLKELSRAIKKHIKKVKNAENLKKRNLKKLRKKFIKLLNKTLNIDNNFTFDENITELFNDSYINLTQSIMYYTNESKAIIKVIMKNFGAKTIKLMNKILKEIIKNNTIYEQNITNITNITNNSNPFNQNNQLNVNNNEININNNNQMKPPLENQQNNNNIQINNNINNQNNNNIQNNQFQQQIGNILNQPNENNQQINNNEINKNAQNNTLVNNNMNNQKDNNNENPINNQINNNIINLNQQLNNQINEKGVNNTNQNEEVMKKNKENEINININKEMNINDKNINNINKVNNEEKNPNNMKEGDNLNINIHNNIDNVNRNHNLNNNTTNVNINPNLNNNKINNINEDDNNKNRNVNFNDLDKGHDEIDDNNNHHNDMNGKNAEDNNEEHDGNDGNN